MPATYEPLATTTLGSAASTITFSSISSAYTDLRVVVYFNIVSGNVARVRFNSDSGSNYSATYFAGSGGGTKECQLQNNLSYIDAAWIPSSSTSGDMALSTFDIFSYSASINKTVMTATSNDNNGSGSVERGVGLWRNTATINAIEVGTVNNQNFTTGTTATLYGILRA